MSELETSGLKSASCLSPAFANAVGDNVYNQISSFVFLQLMNRQPTMKDFCFRLRCMSLQFITLPDLVQKPKVESNVRLLSRYLDGVLQRLRMMDEGGSLYLVLEAVEQALLLISHLFLMVFGLESPAGSEVGKADSKGHSSSISLLFSQGKTQASHVHLSLHRPHDGVR